jgi:hypothetical protein
MSTRDRMQGRCCPPSCCLEGKPVNGRRLALTDLSLVEPMFPKRGAVWNFRVGGDLANPQVIVLEYPDPASVLHLVVHTERPPSGQPRLSSRQVESDRTRSCAG